MFLEPSIASLRGRGSSRGFTLIELMLVVIIIAVMAVMASPLMLEQMRDRRTRENAQRIALIYTTGRARALGRGSSVLVRYKSGTGFSVLESIEGATSSTTRTGNANCAAQPGSGCLSNNWTDPSLSRQVNLFNTPPDLSVSAFNLSGAATTQMDICFTPLGRAFVSFDSSVSPTTSMAGVATIDVQRLTNLGVLIGLKRTLVILPNGMARLGI